MMRTQVKPSSVIAVLAFTILALLCSPQIAFSVEVGADFNGDGFDDLAVGVPFEAIGTIGAAGAVNVIYGHNASISIGLFCQGNQLWHQDSPGILDTAEANDVFGSSLAAGDFNDGGSDDLAVGVPFEDSAARNLIDAGAVNVIYGSSVGLSSSASLPDQLWHQDISGINDTAEARDLFGFSLAAGDFNGVGFDDLAVGVPFENIGARTLIDAGAVNVIYGSFVGLSSSDPLLDQFWHQNTVCFPFGRILDSSEAGDGFGDAVE